LNSDEAVTGLQAYEVLHGKFSLVVGGNQYGSATEAYLLAPILAFWTGIWPIRTMSVLLSAVAAFTLFLLARPFFGRTIAVVLALVGWTMSGAVVLLWTRPYMGYTSGFIAQVAALAFACQAMRTDRKARPNRLRRRVRHRLRIVEPPDLRCGRDDRGRHAVDPSLPGHVGLVASPDCGGLLGVAPWLLFLLGTGMPSSAGSPLDVNYGQRLVNFFTELLPRAFGVLAFDGLWLKSPWSPAPWQWC